MVGSGESVVVRLLSSLGQMAVETDGWTERVTTAAAYTARLWGEVALSALLAGPVQGSLFVAGRTTSQIWTPP